MNYIIFYSITKVKENVNDIMSKCHNLVLYHHKFCKRENTITISL